MARPKLAVWKFASCDGCQLSLLDCENELLALGDLVTFACFPEASSAILRSLMKEITRIAAAEGARRVTAVHVHLGALSHLNEEHFREHFAIESRGTPAEGAAVTVEVGTDALAADAQQVVLRSIEVCQG